MGNVFNLVKDHPKEVFPLFVSFASVILHEFDRKPIVVDVSEESSSGKVVYFYSVHQYGGILKCISELLT
ncbi:hypothetical protein ACDZ29_12290 [Peribacillus sp. RS7]|uniref:hypothetical protein n=1 Tax=Peribacillus sp. RS7 TaxID=3242679 RepID=UPI0035BEEFDF